MRFTPLLIVLGPSLASDEAPSAVGVPPSSRSICSARLRPSGVPAVAINLPVALICQEVLHGGQEEGPKAATLGSDAGQRVLLQQPREEVLRQVLRVLDVGHAPSHVDIERITSRGFAHRLSKLLALGLSDRHACHQAHCDVQGLAGLPTVLPPRLNTEMPRRTDRDRPRLLWRELRSNSCLASRP